MEVGFESKVTAKGQTTIPLEIREHLGILPGDRVRYIINGERVEVLPRNKPASSICWKRMQFPEQALMTTKPLLRTPSPSGIRARRMTDTGMDFEADRHRRQHFAARLAE